MRISALMALILLICMSKAHAVENVLPRYEIYVTLSPGESIVSGKASITLPPRDEYTVRTGELTINSASLDGMPLQAGDGVLRARGGGLLEVAFEGALGVNGDNQDNSIGEKGVLLYKDWYPVVETEEGLYYFSLKALVPEGLTAVSEADEVSSADVPGGVEYSFSFTHPLEGITLAAGSYEVTNERIWDTDISMYTLSENPSVLMERLHKVLDTYDVLFGHFPYPRLSVLEGPLPGGRSTPSLLIFSGDTVSFYQGVLRQWFGSGVYVDYSGGDWSEGLTSYLAYKYSEGLKWDRLKRKAILLDLQSRAAPENEISLAEFRPTQEPAQLSVGRGKGSLVFHMLSEETGEEAFINALRALTRDRKFSRASWDDIRKASEASSGTGLGWFFEQWVTRKGLPHLDIAEARPLLLGGKHLVEFRLAQKPPAYRLSLPVAVAMQEGETALKLVVENETERLKVEVGDTPLALFLDKGFDLARRLHREETAPVLSALFSGDKRIAVTPSTGAEIYENLLGLARERGFTVMSEAEVKDEDLRTSSALVLGLESPVIKRLFGRPLKPFEHRAFYMTLQSGEEVEERWPWPAGYGVVVRGNPLNDSAVIAAVQAGSREEADWVAREIFNRAGALEPSSVIWMRSLPLGEEHYSAPLSGEGGIRAELALVARAVEPAKALSLQEVIQGVMDKDIIYTGEGHPNYQDHKIQLEVIRALHRAGRPFAIGMEMFQQPFQQSLEDYIAGRTGEKEFLLDSEYFKRWRFNYHLYREILDFARTYGIPVVALNQKEEIIKKVSRGGLDALSDEEKREIPPDMDMSDRTYRERLMMVFKEHAGSKDFLNFYQAQILWDETMAHSIDAYLRENPGFQMVVIVGQGHVAYGSGIPERAYRLNGREYATIITSAGGGLDPDVADYVVFAEPMPAPESPLIGVLLDKEGDALVIKEVSGGSPAERAGLKKGDLFISADSIPVEGIEDLKVALFDKKPGETLTVRVKRKKFLARDEELELTVTFPKGAQDGKSQGAGRK